MHSRMGCSVLAMQDGVIAAGLASGIIEIWDPAKLAAGKGEAARITKLDKHKGPVSACPRSPLSHSSSSSFSRVAASGLIWQPNSQACLEWLLCAQVWYAGSGCMVLEVMCLEYNALCAQ